jgi:putative phosphoesterase
VKRIGLLSDSHGDLEPKLLEHFKDCDEIWHAGDWGSGVTEQLEGFKPLRGVYGNIDGTFIRNIYPEILFFEIEKLKVLIIHIGGYPPLYTNNLNKLLDKYNPDLFICGHSHILKVINDSDRKLLHINPGAAGKSGFHIMKTAIRFKVDNGTISNLEVIELGKRSDIS